MLGTMFELVTDLALLVLLMDARARARGSWQAWLYAGCMVAVGAVSAVLIAGLLLEAAGVLR